MSGVRVKICGVTRVEDARLAAELGADYLGLNFFSRSPRLVDLEQSSEIARAVRGQLAIDLAQLILGLFPFPSLVELMGALHVMLSVEPVVH